MLHTSHSADMLLLPFIVSLVLAVNASNQHAQLRMSLWWIMVWCVTYSQQRVACFRLRDVLLTWVCRESLPFKVM